MGMRHYSVAQCIKYDTSYNVYYDVNYKVCETIESHTYTNYFTSYHYRPAHY